MTSSQSGHSARRQQLLRVGIAVGLLAIILGMLTALPADLYVTLFGKTVDHCPNSSLSCPSQTPELVGWLMIPAVLLLWYMEADDD